jgi:hypothetical protein
MKRIWRPGERTVSRRDFLKRLAKLSGGALLLASGCGGSGGGADAGGDGTDADGFGDVQVDVPRRPRTPPGPLLFICLDSLHPGFLELDSNGNLGGKPGSYLMPRLRAFVDKMVWFRSARCWLPSATDMNHLNMLAGTSSAQTGIISVFGQLTGWDRSGKALLPAIHISMARDDQGRPVDTLFDAWKRRWPDSRTALITSKHWIGEMYRVENGGPDLIASGVARPQGRSQPAMDDFCDPPSDGDAACDPESVYQSDFIAPLMGKVPDMFPSDAWLVDAVLQAFDQDPPEMAYVLLAQVDDAGHALGTCHDPAEFVALDSLPDLPEGCTPQPGWKWVSARNPNLFREPMLDVAREADLQFGRLLDGLQARGVLDKATVVLFSDHNMENHLYGSDWFPGQHDQTNYLQLLKDAGLAGDDDVAGVSASTICNVYWRDGKDRVPKARALLEAHLATHPHTGAKECPWWVLDRKAMLEGMPGVCEPGELYHAWLIDQDKEKSIAWPDLVILTRNGWQAPTYLKYVPQNPIPFPLDVPSIAPFIGGHGSVPTRDILLAISTPGCKPHASETPVRISDAAMTVASLFGLTLLSTTVGKDLTAELKG